MTNSRLVDKGRPMHSSMDTPDGYSVHLLDRLLISSELKHCFLYAIIHSVLRRMGCSMVLASYQVIHAKE